MAQLLAGGIIALGVLILAYTIFIATRKPKSSTIQTTDTPSLAAQGTDRNPASAPEAPLLSEEPSVSVAPKAEERGAESVTAASVSVENPAAESTTLAVAPVEPMPLTHDIDQSPLWWREQLQSLTSQLQYLREHARDVERQIAILSEIAILVTELEMLQKKRDISPEGKISIFPLHVHRQPTELSYTTDKRPVVRKYTIEALS